MQRPAIATRPATAADSPALAALLARAFADDPALAYVFPDRATRPRRLLAFFRLILRAESHPADTVVADGAAGDPAAAAVWRAPGATGVPTSTMVRLALPMLRVFGAGLPRALRLQAVVDAHHPAEPHWYLAFAGCEPACHGRGYGGAAIRARLRACDADRLPAALETANEANVALYAALGFRVVDRYDAAPGLRFWAMWREPA